MRFASFILIATLIAPPGWAAENAQAQNQSQIEAQQVAADYVLGRLNANQVVKKLKRKLIKELPTVIETIGNSNAAPEVQRTLFNDLAQAVILDTRNYRRGIRWIYVGAGLTIVAATAVAVIPQVSPEDLADYPLMSETAIRISRGMYAAFMTTLSTAPLVPFLEWMAFRRAGKRIHAAGKLDDCAKELGAQISASTRPALE